MSLGLSSISTSLYIKIAAIIIVPILICFVIANIYERLCDGTSKLYNMTRFGDRDYQMFLRLFDTYRLIDIIEKVCQDYFNDSSFGKPDSENTEDVLNSLEIGTQNNDGIMFPPGEDDSASRNETIKKQISLIEQVESKKNRGKYEKAFRFLDKELPQKTVS